MPLSKAKNRDRMREIRLHKPLSTPYQSKAVQPNIKKAIESMVMPDYGDKFHCGYIDADGNPVYGD